MARKRPRPALLTDSHHAPPTKKFKTTTHRPVLVADELWCLIWQHLPLAQLVHSVQLVCKYWKNLLFSSPIPWQNICFQSGGAPLHYEPIISKFKFQDFYLKQDLADSLQHLVHVIDPNRTILQNCANTLQHIDVSNVPWRVTNLVFPHVYKAALNDVHNFSLIKKQFPQLCALALHDCTIPTVSLAHIDHLTSLTLEDCLFDDKIHGNVQFSKLNKLRLTSSAELLEILQNDNPFPNVAHLYISGVNGSKFGTLPLHKLFPSLARASFYFMDAAQVTKAVLKCQNLTKLHIKESSWRGQFMQQLAQVTSASFRIDGYVNCDELRHLFPNLKRLCLNIDATFTRLDKVFAYYDSQKLRGTVIVSTENDEPSVIRYPPASIEHVEISTHDHIVPELDILAIVAILEGKTTKIDRIVASWCETDLKKQQLVALCIHRVLQVQYVKNVPQAIYDYWQAQFELIDKQTILDLLYLFANIAWKQHKDNVD